MTYKNFSQVVRRDRCPICASQGKDTSGNNLAVYADGGKFCFSCNKVIALSDTYKKQNGLTEYEVINERKIRFRNLG